MSEGKRQTANKKSHSRWGSRRLPTRFIRKIHGPRARMLSYFSPFKGTITMHLHLIICSWSSNSCRIKHLSEQRCQVKTQFSSWNTLRKVKGRTVDMFCLRSWKMTGCRSNLTWLALSHSLLSNRKRKLFHSCHFQSPFGYYISCRIRALNLISPLLIMRHCS